MVHIKYAIKLSLIYQFSGYQPKVIDDDVNEENESERDIAFRFCHEGISCGNGGGNKPITTNLVFNWYLFSRHENDKF